MNRTIKDFINLYKDFISLWTINIIQYSAIITLLDYNNVLKEFSAKNEKTQPRWRVFLKI